MNWQLVKLLKYSINVKQFISQSILIFEEYYNFLSLISSIFKRNIQKQKVNSHALNYFTATVFICIAIPNESIVYEPMCMLQGTHNEAQR